MAKHQGCSYEFRIYPIELSITYYDRALAEVELGDIGGKRMLKVTNNTADFFEKQTGEIIIYGAGNAGYWIGNYMHKCNMDFSYYIDRNVSYEGALLNDRPVFLDKKLENQKGQVRIIVSPHCYAEILDKLLEIDRKYDLQAICLVPKYKGVIAIEEIYNINILLAYFRRRLLKIKMPIFISNNCTAGNIYELFNYIQLSPTINTGMHPENYVKFCKDYKHYLDCELADVHMERTFALDTGEIMEIPVARLDDIKIYFAHNYCLNDVKTKWEIISKRLVFDDIVFLFSDNSEYLPLEQRILFSELEQPHWLILSRCGYMWGKDIEHSIRVPGYIFGWAEQAIENVFDLVDWINHIYD